VKQYHTDTRVSIVAIYDLAQKAFSKHSDRHPELAGLVQALFIFFDDLLFHLKQEEQILFPNIIELSEKKLHEGGFNYGTFGLIKEYALTMQNEHQDVIRQLEFFRRLTNNYELPDAAVLYQSLLSKMKEFDHQMIQHIEFENNFLLPRAIMMDENLRC
jgi:regulator of cell morphogenesis and NO signaling